MKHWITLAALLAGANAFAADTSPPPDPSPPPKAAATAAVPAVSKPAVPDRLAAPRKAIAAKEWVQAIALLEEVVRSEPGNADAYNLLGYSLRKQPKPNLAKAFENYNAALRINPRHLGAHEYIGEAYLMDGKPAQAQKHLSELEKICGNKTCEEYEDLAKALAAYRAKK